MHTPRRRGSSAGAILVVLRALAAFGVPTARASTMPVQGSLRDHAGNPVQQGAFRMTFRLYDQAGAPVADAVWTETHPPEGVECADQALDGPCVAVRDGVFTARLGEHTDGGLAPSIFRSHDALWLGISVEGEPELPRQPLGAVGRAAFAEHAALAEDVACGGCLEASDVDFRTGSWSTSDGDVHRTTGRVGLGTGSPDGSRMHIANDGSLGDGEAALRLEAGGGDWRLGTGREAVAEGEGLFASAPGASDALALTADGRLGAGRSLPPVGLAADGAIGLGDTDAACTSEAVGTIRYDAAQGTFEGCIAGSGSPGWIELGRRCDTPRTSCLAHHQAGCRTSGFYDVDPDGSGGTEPVDVFCDMGSDDGGWMRVVRANYAAGEACPEARAKAKGGTLRRRDCEGNGCFSAVDFDTHGVAYDEVRFHAVVWETPR